MSENNSAVWCISFDVPEAHLAIYELALEPLEGAIVVTNPDAAGMISAKVYVDGKPSQEQVEKLLSDTAGVMGGQTPEALIEQLPDIDWVAESQKALPPIVAGKFFVHGSHITQAPPEGSVPLLIEANVAFGTGQHDTTKGCLIALTDLADDRKITSALDMGCGSGILAMGIKILWDCPVLAIDIDADSVRVALENATLNKVSGITGICGDGYATAEVSQQAPFDLIVANILAEPLCQMAPELEKNLAPGGIAVLSGLLITQQEQVVKAQEAQGLKVIRELHLGEWATLVLSR
ncbi:50S ribosomal protein L11 methyltransferase [Kiloniella laminariae]|uniref:50S ribosomal protein L11 methyltransferase n=1 Tax=Kiloniella laminariae TaxID=454162 RepID=UPI0003638528|nr:50S ribosomal protein L11 methyltransferase [Kiloniella laminariae]